MEDVSHPEQTWMRMNESLVKYLSGLFDADGSASFNFRLGRDKTDQYYASLHLRIATSVAVDREGFVMSIPHQNKIGAYYPYGNGDQFGVLVISKRSELEMVAPRLVKHMVVKAKHVQRMFDMWKEVRGKLLSKEECDSLREFSKESRRNDGGPLKAKNHPSWAWLAGFLDGDGWYRMGTYKTGSYKGRDYYATTLSVGAVSHVGDSEVLNFLQKAYGGTISDHSTPGCKIWVRNLGKSQSSFALKFLPQLVRHARLKRYKIEQMIAFHHQQRPSDQTATAEAMV